MASLKIYSAISVSVGKRGGDVIDEVHFFKLGMTEFEVVFCQLDYI